MPDWSVHTSTRGNRAAKTEAKINYGEIKGGRIGKEE